MSKDLNLDIKQISQSGKVLLRKARTYASFIFVLGVLLIYVFLVWRISILAQAEPSDEAVTEKMGTVKRLKVDQSAIDKIEQLEDQNIAVQSLFETARDNPFQD